MRFCSFVSFCFHKYFVLRVLAKASCNEWLLLHIAKEKELSKLIISIDYLSSESEWEVYPKEIELDSSLPSTECRLRIHNNTSKSLPFEFIWPAETLVITPSKDKVPPFDSLGIRIDARHTFLAKHEEESWAGCVYVQCGCEQKVRFWLYSNIKIKLSKRSFQRLSNLQTQTFDYRAFALWPSPVPICISYRRWRSVWKTWRNGSPKPLRRRRTPLALHRWTLRMTFR